MEKISLAAKFRPKFERNTDGITTTLPGVEPILALCHFWPQDEPLTNTCCGKMIPYQELDRTKHHVTVTLKTTEQPCNRATSTKCAKNAGYPEDGLGARPCRELQCDPRSTRNRRNLASLPASLRPYTRGMRILDHPTST